MTNKGTLYFLIGKMGAGKSTHSKTLAEQVGAIRISEDDWLSLLYPDEIQTFDDFVVRHRRLLSVIRPHVQQLLSVGNAVVLDFPANTQRDRQWFVQLATDVAAAHRAVYLSASDDVCLARIAQRRVAQPERAAFDNEAVFTAVTKLFEPPQQRENLNLEEWVQTL
ncbi:AAA family ATPase [Reinekea blandensis]|nr:ATP-binding protein [Reinekea blandensis]